MARLDRSLIKDLPPFRGLTDDERDRIVSLAQPRRIEHGKPVFEQGEKAEHFFVLLDGQLKVVQVKLSGEQIVVRFVSPGELFGIAVAIGRDTFPGTAIAVVDSLALAWPSRVWPELMASHPRLGSSAMQTLGARLEETRTRLHDLTSEQVDRRIARALLRLARQSGRKTESGVAIEFPVTRQDLAEMTGTTLHTVSRVLSAWEKEGVLRSSRRDLVITDPHGLVMRADED